MNAKVSASLEPTRLAEPATSEEMDRRRRLAADLRALWRRPLTDTEEDFWQRFESELQRERLSFR